MMSVVIVDKFDNSRETLQVVDLVDSDFFYLITYKRKSDNKLMVSYRCKSRYTIFSA